MFFFSFGERDPLLLLGVHLVNVCVRDDSSFCNCASISTVTGSSRFHSRRIVRSHQTSDSLPFVTRHRSIFIFNAVIEFLLKSRSLLLAVTCLLFLFFACTSLLFTPSRAFRDINLLSIIREGEVTHSHHGCFTRHLKDRGPSRKSDGKSLLVFNRTTNHKVIDSSIIKRT